MREPEADIAELDESRPKRCRIPWRRTHLWFVNPTGSPVDESALCERLSGERRRRQVRAVTFLHNSLLPSTKLLTAFPNLGSVALLSDETSDLSHLLELRHLWNVAIGAEGAAAKRDLSVIRKLHVKCLGVRICRKDDLEHINHAAGVQDLGLGMWPKHDFSAISNLALEHLTIRGGAARSTAGINCERMKFMAFIGYRKLCTLEEIATTELYLDGSAQLDLNTLRNVGRLRRLRMSWPRPMESLEFLRGCRELTHLVLNASIASPSVDLSPVFESPTLPKVWLAVPDAYLLAVGMRNTRLTLCNGQIVVHAGNIEPYGTRNTYDQIP